MTKTTHTWTFRIHTVTTTLTARTANEALGKAGCLGLGTSWFRDVRNIDGVPTYMDRDYVSPDTPTTV